MKGRYTDEVKVAVGKGKFSGKGNIHKNIICMQTTGGRGGRRLLY